MARFAFPLVPALALTLFGGPAFAQTAEDPPAESPIISGMKLMMAAKAEEVDAKSKQLGDLRFGALPVNQSASLSVDVDVAKAHLIVAACDFDCVAIDLKAEDEAGNVIAEHKGAGDLPTLDIKPGAAATLKVSLTMTDCKVAACRVGLGVFQRSKP